MLTRTFVQGVHDPELFPSLFMFPSTFAWYPRTLATLTQLTQPLRSSSATHAGLNTLFSVEDLRPTRLHLLIATLPRVTRSFSSTWHQFYVVHPSRCEVCTRCLSRSSTQVCCTLPVCYSVWSRTRSGARVPHDPSHSQVGPATVTTK